MSVEKIAQIVKPDTILAWQRKLAAQKFDGSKKRKPVGRPRVDKDLEDWVVQMAKENRSWGYDRIAGALADLGYEISDQNVGNILKRRGIPRAPDRKKMTTWREFIRTHMDVLWATDFFSTEVWTLGGLVTFYVLFFGLDHGIGHFMIFEVDSGAQAAVPLSSRLPQTSSVASGRKTAPLLSCHQAE